MKRTGIISFMVFMLAGIAIEQAPPFPSVDLLGAHSIGGRSCLACHPPYSGGEADAGNAGVASWGPSTLPPYGKTIAFGSGGRAVEIPASEISAINREVEGVLVCLSCHDGNLTPPSMMAGQSFEQRIGLLPRPASDEPSIPTLSGNPFDKDHPVGVAAVIRPGNGLVWVNNTFRVIPGSPYAQFVAHYGRPVLTPGPSSNPWGVNSSGEPFVLCTTCHNQHTMTVYASTPSSPIASDGGGRFYPTFFFINGPYDPNPRTPINTNASSSMQFCRQCHFTDSNEANNANTVPTILTNE